MCNLYSLTKGQAAIRDWFRARHDRTGNLPLFSGIFPDQMAPIVRASADGERELVMARWGPVRLNMLARQSPTFAISPAPTGRDGSARETAASFPQPHFASTRTPSPTKRPSGSLSGRIGHHSPSRAYGLPGAAYAVLRALRWKVCTSCSAS
jgi:hypothetical protein